MSGKLSWKLFGCCLLWATCGYGEVPEIENAMLRVSINSANGVLSVLDKRTGRTWKGLSETAALPEGWSHMSVRQMHGHELVLTSSSSRFTNETVCVGLEGAEVSVSVALSRDREIRKLRYPHAFSTQKGDRLIVPYNEGMSYPVDEVHQELGTAGFFCGFRLSMHFFGIADEKTGAGVMGIVECPEDATLEVSQHGPDRLWTVGPGWIGEYGKVGYVRRIRYVFLSEGGHVAFAKRFRVYAKGRGWLKTFKEKAIQRPNVLKLPGMPNFWAFVPDKDKVAHAKELKSLGIDRFLWSSGGCPETVRQISSMQDVLVGCYDCMQDVQSPSLMAHRGLAGKKGQNGDAWPHDIMWTGAGPETWRKGWGIEIKKGTNTVMDYCAVMCDVKAPFYLHEKLLSELRLKPYTSRFMDTTFSSPWQECTNPAHRQTRRECHFWRRELLRMMADQFGLVTGSERGSCSGVPVVDYYEGMMSISLCGVPRDGRDILIPWTNALPRVVSRYQVGAKYRIPLWELVFHDCCCAHWYWGDTQNKIPAIWDDRTLFNVLYGTAPMFLYDEKQWLAIRGHVVKTCLSTLPIIRSVGFSEMTDHSYLTDDLLVQRTQFANGVEITVNFSQSDWVDEKGTRLSGRSFFVSKSKKKNGR